MLLSLPVALSTARAQAFGVCKPVVQRTSEIGCWILTDHLVGRISQAEVYWHLDRYADSAEAQRARESAGARSAVVHSLGRWWLMTLDDSAWRPSHPGAHVAAIGPLRVALGKEY